MNTILVYDRMFLRVHDKYIPFCLYGDTSCVEKVGSREVRARYWANFNYCDEMLCADKETLMREVKNRHSGSAKENFKFNNAWLDDAAVIRFFAKGIKNAVTIEEIQQQLGTDEILNASLQCWSVNGSKPESQQTAALHTSDEIIQWVETAKTNKAEMLATGNWKAVYIVLQFPGRKPKHVLPNSTCNSPLIAKLKNNYVVQVADEHGKHLMFGTDITQAIVFENIEAAHEAMPYATKIGLHFIPAVEKEKAMKKNWVLSVNRTDLPDIIARDFVRKCTYKHCYFTFAPKQTELRFTSPEAALEFYEKKIKPYFSYVIDPQPVKIEYSEC